MSKNYLGIDLHKKWCVYTEIDSTGKVIRQSRFGNTFEEVSIFASSLNSRVHLVIEPVLNYLWLLDQLEPYVGSVHVATPYKVRVIAESKTKTDKYDSRILAELLRTNFLPESWIPPRSLRALRAMVRQRCYLVKTQTMFKNRIRHLLCVHGVTVRFSDISSVRAQREMAGMCLSFATRQSIDQCLEVITGLKKSIGELDQQLAEQSHGVPQVALLRTIPGVGPIWSVTIYAEVGDITRFSSRKAFASYSGLVPSVRASGNSVHYGGITHLGSKPLRHALVEVAISIIRKSPELRRLFTRVLFRGNVQKARVAVARKLATIIYAMLKNNEPFRLQQV